MSRKNKPHGNNSQVLKDFGQLKSATSRIPASPAQWGADGEDHICIDRKANTELGRALSTGTDINWSHPVLGYFRSFDNLWYFLSVGKPHDALRRLQRREAIEFARNECGGLAYYPNIEAVYLDSIYRYLKSKKHLATLMIECTLPFDIYYTNLGGIRSRRATNLWLVDGYYEIQKALQENREPVLTPWVTHSDQHIYHDVMVALGADPSQTEQLFKRAVESREAHRVRQRPRPENTGRVIKERSIQSIDPVSAGTTLSIKVRTSWETEEKPLDGGSQIPAEDLKICRDQSEEGAILDSGAVSATGIDEGAVIDPATDFETASVTTITGEPVAGEEGVSIEGAALNSGSSIVPQAEEDPYAYARDTGEDPVTTPLVTETEKSGAKSDDSVSEVNHAV